jgi:hypothetical protein
LVNTTSLLAALEAAGSTAEEAGAVEETGAVEEGGAIEEGGADTLAPDEQPVNREINKTTMIPNARPRFLHFINTLLFSKTYLAEAIQLGNTKEYSGVFIANTTYCFQEHTDYFLLNNRFEQLLCQLFALPIYCFKCAFMPL